MIDGRYSFSGGGGGGGGGGKRSAVAVQWFEEEKRMVEFGSYGLSSSVAEQCGSV
ncbi:hypothetical protein A2U01_0032635, partial [Trifolium medium]|nr:hypothetical protein [Trifolium medium]